MRKKFSILDEIGEWGDILFGPSTGKPVQGMGAGALEGAGGIGP